MNKFKFRVIAIFCLIILIIQNVTIVVSASTLYGFGFAYKPITIYADNSLSDDYVNQLKQAIDVWNSTRVGTVFIYGGRRNLISTYWFPDGYSGVVEEPLGDSRTGVTSTKQNGVNITEADIAINSNLTFNNGATTTGQYYLKSVLIHELGHVLGLDDNYDISSVMYYAYTGRTALSSNDINDLDILY